MVELLHVGHSLVVLVLLRDLHVGSPLVHGDLEGGHILFLKVDAGGGHVSIHHLRKQTHITTRVSHYSLHETVLLCTANNKYTDKI